MRRTNYLRKRSGVVLIMSLMLLGAIALSALYLSLVLLNEIRSTRYTDNGIIAHYVAESAAEEALWRLKIARSSDPTFFSGSEGDPVCAAEDNGTYRSCTTGYGDVERIADFETVSIDAFDFIAYDILQNRPVLFDIYDPELEGTMTNTSINQVGIDWFVPECNGDEQLEISYATYNFQNGTLGTPITDIDECACNADTATGTYDETVGGFSCTSDPIDPAAWVTISPNYFYRFSFRSLASPVVKLIASAYDVEGATVTPVPVPSQVEIVARGQYRESEATVNLRASWRDALSGIFNFVVFSEETLIKDTLTAGSSSFKPLCGFCSDSTASALKPCNSNAQCVSPATCSILNDPAEVDQDGAASTRFCSEEEPDPSGNETYVADSINQTDAGKCNAYCNGLTLCGDEVVQSPNGAGWGGLLSDGFEECDNGLLNSDTEMDACRTNCVEAYCGDGVRDTGEECDDGPHADTPSYMDTSDDDGVCVISAYAATSCVLNVCGDGYLDYNAEYCDDGLFNGNGSSYCYEDCSGIEP